MERLDFKLPEFSRFIWVSEEAKNVWLSRFQHISVAWELVERFSVISGVRQAALQTVTPDALIPLSNWATSHGLVVVPLARQGVSDGYQNATVEYSEGNPWTYRVVICTPQYARDFVEAWNVGNDNVIGTLLGFPGCCREFYKWSWVEGNWRDVALTSAIGKSAAKSLCGFFWSWCQRSWTLSRWNVVVQTTRHKALWRYSHEWFQVYHSRDGYVWSCIC